ncbi:hypothetical protein P8936_16405 [Edaphobacter paludis]|uniref:Uncharacterized protein n=1 Tax=Edaphobacter paludis TaxID=3035702 RepID=A0AAU7D7P5_9BACT
MNDKEKVLWSALDRLRKNAQHIFDGKAVRDWAETLAEADAALAAVNAAESLPVSSEQEIDVSIDAPMMDYEEAGKEAYAEQRVIVFRAIPTGQKFAAHPEGHYVALTKPSRTVAEPKPTPSTPAHSVQVTYEGKGAHAGCVCGWGIHQDTPVSASGFVQAMAAEHLSKPQPDSSSIPVRSRSYHEGLLKNLADPVEAMAYVQAAIDDSPEAFWKAVKNVAEARDSSSISTGHTFEEWIEIYSHRVVDNGATPISPMERSAKGQSNGR